MSTASKSDRSQGTLLRFPRREPVQLDAELKAFLDEIVIPILIRGAVEELRKENLLESERYSVADCAQSCTIAEANR